MWGGRFSEPADDLLRALNDSLGFDKRMAAQDVAGSIAYARAIAKVGILTQGEMTQIIRGLEQVKAEFDAGTFEFKAGDEDIHTAVERRLTEIVGEVGGKLHTGRSRNDQVATDFRLWVMQAILQMDNLLLTMQQEIILKAEAHIETVMPGYTHMQPAQPITVAHWLMSFFWMLARDRERLQDTLKRTSVMPLGSGALAGTPLNIDREALAEELGFSAYSMNSLDGVSDRDFVAEMLFTLSLIGVHLSRLGEDIVFYSNPLFGYITLNDRYSTGSSLMPQKRNADPMELARGKAGRIIGHLTGFLTTLKGLPTGYNKDIQEDKEALFDAFDTLSVILPVVTAIIHTLKINENKMRAALNEDMLATDLADYLVDKGLPFRQAHHVVGELVQIAGESGIKLSELTLEQFQSTSALFAQDVYSWFDFDDSVKRRAAIGGTAPQAVLKQIEWAKSLVLVAQ